MLPVCTWVFLVLSVMFTSYSRVVRHTLTTVFVTDAQKFTNSFTTVSDYQYCANRKVARFTYWLLQRSLQQTVSHWSISGKITCFFSIPLSLTVKKRTFRSKHGSSQSCKKESSRYPLLQKYVVERLPQNLGGDNECSALHCCSSFWWGPRKCFFSPENDLSIDDNSPHRNFNLLLDWRTIFGSAQAQLWRSVKLSISRSYESRSRWNEFRRIFDLMWKHPVFLFLAIWSTGAMEPLLSM